MTASPLSRKLTRLGHVGNGDGLMVLRMLLAVAANESSTKSRRVKRKMLRNAEAGIPRGGYHRPFGYEDDDKITVRQDEAQIIRAVAERFLAGESLRSLAVWLDEQGIATVSGKPWRAPTVRSILSGGRIAGLRDHQGQVIGKAVWEPIISEQTRARILSRMAEQKTSGRRRCRQQPRRMRPDPSPEFRCYFKSSGEAPRSRRLPVADG